MTAPSGLESEILVNDDVFVIRAERRVVWCEVNTPRQLSPARGAEAAQAIAAYMLENVLQRRSRWLGLIIDVRRGPSVVGPITLETIERMFERAETCRKPVAALVSAAAAQADQYETVIRTHAPRFGKVVLSPADALEWMTAARLGG